MTRSACRGEAIDAVQEPRESLYRFVSVTDGLAAERTYLAAERTLLAYLRTAFAMFLAGFTGARLLDDAVLETVAVVLAVSSLFVLGFGLARYRRSLRVTSRLLTRAAPPSRE